MAVMDERLYYLNEREQIWVMLPSVKEQYQKIIRKQTEEWQKGNSLHTNQLGVGYELPDGMEHECCPDFSCCDKKLEWPQEKKDLFIRMLNEGNEEVVNQMLFSSLAAVSSSFKEDVYIAGQITDKDIQTDSH